MYSALVGLTARRRLPVPLRTAAYRAFARAVGADLDEAELDLRAYSSLGDLFARRLRPGCRPVCEDLDAIISPCDGVLAARGTAVDGALVQAKGKNYQVEDLVVDPDLAAELRGGDYATIYLSPRPRPNGGAHDLARRVNRKAPDREAGAFFFEETK